MPDCSVTLTNWTSDVTAGLSLIVAGAFVLHPASEAAASTQMEAVSGTLNFTLKAYLFLVDSLTISVDARAELSACKPIFAFFGSLRSIMAASR